MTSVLVGCQPDEEARPDVCARYCGAIERCDSSLDEMECIEECNDDRGVKTELYEIGADCIEQVSCNESEQSCVSDGIRKMDLSSTGRSMCASLSSYLKRCNADFDEGDLRRDCEGNAVYIADGYAQALTECTQLSCDLFDYCVLNSASDFGTGSFPLTLSDGAGGGDTYAPNSCTWSYDGECDEGGLCDYGTDTFDCEY